MMYIPNFIRQIPTHFDNALIYTIVQGAKVKQSIDRIWMARQDAFYQSDFWKLSGKPFYERNIAPLERTDYLFLGGSLAAAVLVTLIAVRVATFAALPFGLIGGSLIVTGTCLYLHQRARSYFDNIAWTHIDQIKTIAENITRTNQQFADISHHRAKLQQPEFDYLNDQLKKLDEEIDKFKTVVLSPDRENRLKIVKAHLVYLDNLVQANPHDKALVDALQQEVDKFSQNKEDLQALETSKQNLHDLQIDAARLQFDELSKQIHSLEKAAESPDLEDGRKAFIEFLEGFQKKLIP